MNTSTRRLSSLGVLLSGMLLGATVILSMPSASASENPPGTPGMGNCGHNNGQGSGGIDNGHPGDCTVTITAWATATATVTATETQTATVTESVPGPTVTATVTEHATSVVTEHATETVTNEVPGPTVTQVVAGPTVTNTVTNEVTHEVQVPGPESTVTVINSVLLPPITEKVEVPGPTVTTTAPGKTSIVDHTVTKQAPCLQGGGALAFTGLPLAMQGAISLVMVIGGLFSLFIASRFKRSH